MSGRPLLLDLFCGAGGAAMGYHRAGFDVVGVDNKPQPNYPFPFVEHDALEFIQVNGRGDFALIHASPPCQAHATMSNRWKGAGGLRDERVSLIADTRIWLERLGVPYVIENVVGAKRELRHPVSVCGRVLGCEMHRHRLFESVVPLVGTVCDHGRCNHAVYGKAPDGRLLWRRVDGSEQHCVSSVEHARDLMGMPWAGWRELCEAIPPAYTEHIGSQLLAALETQAAA